MATLDPRTASWRFVAVTCLLLLQQSFAAPQQTSSVTTTVAVTQYISASSFSPNGRFICMFAGPGLAPFQEIKTYLVFDTETTVYRTASILPSGQPMPTESRCFVDDTGSLVLFDANLPVATYRNDSIVGVFVRNLDQGVTHTIPAPDGFSPPYRVRQFINGSFAVISDNSNNFFYASLNPNGSFSSWVTLNSSRTRTGFVTNNLSYMAVFEPEVGYDVISILNSTGDVVSTPSTLLFSEFVAVSSHGRTFLRREVYDNSVGTFTILEDGSIQEGPAVQLSDITSPVFLGSVSDDGYNFTLRAVSQSVSEQVDWVCSLTVESSTWSCNTFYYGRATISPQGNVLIRSYLDYSALPVPPVLVQRNGTEEPLLSQECIYDSQFLCDLRDDIIGVRDYGTNAPNGEHFPVTNFDGSVIAWTDPDGFIHVRNMMTGRNYNFTWEDGSVFQGRSGSDFAPSVPFEFSKDGSKLFVSFSSDPRCGLDSYYGATLDLRTEKAIGLYRDVGGCAYKSNGYAYLSHDGSALLISSTNLNETLQGNDALYMVDFLTNTTRPVPCAEYGIGTCLDGYLFKNRSSMLLYSNTGLWIVNLITLQTRLVGDSWLPQYHPLLVSEDERIVLWVQDSRVVWYDLVAGGPPQVSTGDTGFTGGHTSAITARCTNDLRYCGVYSNGDRFFIYDRLTDSFTDGFGDRFYLYPGSHYPVISGNGNRIVFPTFMRLSPWDVNPGADVYSCNRQIEDCRIASVRSSWPLPPAAPPMDPPVAPPVEPPANPPQIPPAASESPISASPVSSQAPVQASPVAVAPLATLFITLNGTVAPNNTEVDIICNIIAASFQPALRVPEDITCRLSAGSRRSAMASFTVVVEATNQNSANSLNTAGTSSAFQSAVSAQLATSLPNFSVQSISTPQTAPIATPASNVAPTASGSQPQTTSSSAPSGSAANQTGGLEGGAIAGIVIAAILAVVIVFVIVFLVVRRGSKADSSGSNAKKADAPPAAMQMSKATNDESSSSESSGNSSSKTSASSAEPSSESAESEEEDSDELSRDESGESSQEVSDESEEASESQESSEASESSNEDSS